MIFMKRIIATIIAVLIVLAGIFAIGRYGWRIFGFSACSEAVVSDVRVENDRVRITGTHSGSVPSGFCGYLARQEGNTLYVGFRFSSLFGIASPGNFDIIIPAKGEVLEVILKNEREEISVWNAKDGYVPSLNRCGVFVKLERNDVYHIGMSYLDSSCGVSSAEGVPLEKGDYIFMDNDIMEAGLERNQPVFFTISIKDKNEQELTSKSMYFDSGMRQMYLTVSKEGDIVVDNRNE